MKKHSFRWENLAFGLFFLAAAGNWLVWKQEALSPRQFSLTASAVLITLGVIGVAATIWQARPAPTTSAPTTSTPTTSTPTPLEGDLHEEADPQP